MERTKWTERKFNFDSPSGWLPNILERLRGTAARMNEMTSSLNELQTSRREEDKWSIKEHIGHLSDLEEIHSGRIDDFLAGKKQLRPADMTNAKTNQAGHNTKSLKHLLNDFAVKRKHFVNRFNELGEEIHDFKSLHPRLKKRMRPVDLAYFIAEHDDHHLATMRGIIDALKK